jgi:CoA:oxalate CoA-transferase
MADVKSPLEGIRVLDLGRHQAGPRCAQVLARLGAEVIKVERLEGEETRHHGPFAKGQSAYFVQYNSGKKSLAMDLRKEPARKILRDLVKVSDVFLQNFRPGTIDKMGFGWDILQELNPRIIMINVSAYGQFGPYSEKIGYDPIGQALAGIMMTTGSDGMPPIQTGVPIIDRTTALHSAIGVLAALFERTVSGKGQSIDVCLADSGYSLTEIPITAIHAGTEVSARGRAGNTAPSGVYPCKDGWVLITAGDQHQWPRVCRALDKPEWVDDERFSKRHFRGENSAPINEAIVALLAKLTMAEAIDHFTRHDITAAPVNTTTQAEADPHPWVRRTMVEVPDPIAGTIAVSGDYWHFSRSEVPVGSTPTVGQHTDELLSGLLGFSPDKLAELREASVIA